MRQFKSIQRFHERMKPRFFLLNAVDKARNVHGLLFIRYEGFVVTAGKGVLEIRKKYNRY